MIHRDRNLPLRKIRIFQCQRGEVDIAIVDVIWSWITHDGEIVSWRAIASYTSVTASTYFGTVSRIDLAIGDVSNGIRSVELGGVDRELWTGRTGHLNGRSDSQV